MNKPLVLDLPDDLADWLDSFAQTVSEASGEEVTAATVAEGILQGAFLDTEQEEMDLRNKDDEKYSGNYYQS